MPKLPFLIKLPVVPALQQTTSIQQLTKTKNPAKPPFSSVSVEHGQGQIRGAEKSCHIRVLTVKTCTY